jgi:large subunit ribosomal protein L19
MRSIDAVHHDKLRRDLPELRAGDTVRVHVKIREGEKERIQIFEGVVIQRRGGGHSASFTVRKISSGVGVERIFPIESPSVTSMFAALDSSTCASSRARRRACARRCATWPR